ncbi:hypothetical protein AVT69_gp361 [Pseudomonas phage PhiPA3]|uniref:Uncharacterized protein 375 n=1 Tax=Pseudomonas phage PhiPA3 TaxID=998086 RepID=F8SJK7_BPPA3|nr:hypothetical protein AVT69_gp361 [Pseudomonas phage PhiPA3]AEH03798.1 hypothetical protein [Pseudomonas phage PhiPA3]
MSNILVELMKTNISIEEEFNLMDYIEDFFDQVADGSGADVDPDEQPSPTPVIQNASAILNSLGGMIPYMNLSGKSNVQSYKFVQGQWILVAFGDNSFYLYSIKSLPPIYLANMIELAQIGRGLNSYINKTIKGDYAAKLVKGQVMVRPGMESYVDKPITLYIHLSFESTDVQTLKRYQTSLKQAGQDGLKDDAKQALRIGVRMIDGVNVGLEDFSSNIGETDIAERIEKLINN